MTTGVRVQSVDPNGYGFNPSSDEIEPNRTIELTFELDDTTIDTVSCENFGPETKAAAITAFMTWLERLQSYQTTKNEIALLEEKLEGLLDPVG